MASLSPILDVIIGLAGVYIAFSLLASWVQEWFARILNLRSKGLVSGIYQLFNGDTSAFTQFVNDPMFQALLTSGKRALPPPVVAAADNAAKTAEQAAQRVEGAGRTIASDADKMKNVASTSAVLAALEKVKTDPESAMKTLAKIAPSYLSKEQFGAIFMNMIANHPKGNVVKAAAALLQPAPPGDPQPGSGTAPGSSQGAAPTPAQLAQQFAADVKSAGDALGVGPQVNAILAQAGGDSEKFLAAIENWYDDHMDRVTGWYKRKSQRILLFIGLGLAIVFNVDSIRLYAGLSCNSALRGAVAIAAATAGSPRPSAAQGASGENAASPAPSPAPSASPQNAASATPSPTPSPADAVFVQQMLNAIPIGWRWPYADGKWQRPDDALMCDRGTAWDPPNTIFYLFTKLLGFVITMFALSLGAPFWFDTLSRLTNVRAAGNKPDTSRKKA